ncbi:DUF21 domain-containing protein [Salicibibacter halophilus]|uniref:DUF21 domain-containing protein n=1 Tax=Salicibibacter halophilus TaxID=2502791 RepID=A0A514LL75_9BACI|nr:DUF21 domain-containing protein [Salicibibacter halophilus]
MQPTCKWIIAIILLFIASSFFSGSETALTAANKIKIQTRAENGDKKSQKNAGYSYSIKTGYILN